LRAHLPGYPFARERHWLPAPDEAAAVAAMDAIPPATGAIESIRPPASIEAVAATAANEAPAVVTRPAAPPLSQRLQQLRPWLAAPELARVAAERHVGGAVQGLSRLVWSREGGVRTGGDPRWMRDGASLLYALEVPGSEGGIAHFGEVDARAPAPLPRVQAGRLRAGMRPVAPPSAAVAAAWGHATQRVAALRTPEAGGLIATDGLLAAWSVIADWLGAPDGAPWLPLAVRQVDAFAPLPPDSLLHLARKGTAGRTCRFDLGFYDADGRACLRLEDLTVTRDPRLLEPAAGGAA
jgi:hypothetical protein